MERARAFALIIGALLIATTASISAAWADQRIALVIGNGRYLNTPALDNPANDAVDVAAALTNVGFKVTVRLDSSKREFDQALAQFSRDAKTSDAALFYYAGHGMQFQGRNYLMPIDAELRDEVSLRYEMTTVDEVKDALQASSGVKVLVLDSCRNNPLANQLMRSISTAARDVPRVQGFAREERANGIVIVYSTQANEIAHDGSGRNSPFSAAFLKELREPGLEVGTLFRRVESDVFQATGGTQSPELSISMVPEYYLNQAETDQLVWSRVRGNADMDTLKKFLARYPNSFYAPDAAARLSFLEARQPASGVAAATALSAPSSDTDKTGPVRERELATRLAAAEAEKARLDEELARMAKTGGAPEPRNPESSGGIDHKPATVASTMSSEPAPLVPEIRGELRRLGCFAGGELDWNNSALKLGVAKYVRYANLANSTPSPDEVLLDDMKKRRAGLCPPECLAREAVVGGRCVAKSCPSGALLSRAGICVQRAPAPVVREADDNEARSARPTRPHPRPHTPAASGGGGHCFSFNGNQYCE